MKKLVILSCSTGQGHNSCAQAIKEYFEQKNISCDICDALAFISKRFAEFISWGHSYVYKHLPGLFRWGYRYSETHPAMFERDSCIHKMLTAGTERMHSYIVEGQYDTVICTHVFSAIMLTHMRKTHNIAVNTAFVATDYTYYPGMEACDLDNYFIADESLVDDYAKCGIPRQCIIPSGIPVRQRFFEKEEKDAAKRLLEIDAQNRHLLIMCGSMGCGPMKTILRHTVKGLPKQAEVSVICGTNKRLYKQLNRRYSRNGRVHIVGYTDQVSLYMDSADLYLTKPGGISVTEAAAKRLPMLFINAIAGCEQYNMDFYLHLRSATAAKRPRDIARKSIELLRSDSDRHFMEDRLCEYRQPDGASHIYDELSRCNSGACPDRALQELRYSYNSVCIDMRRKG